jgi:putative ABC transport system permease protein
MLFSQNPHNLLHMLKNYLTVALRNLLRNKVFSAINILGLSIGISSALVIYLIAHYDFSFDRFEPGGDRIYRVVNETAFQGNISHGRGVPAPLGEAIRKELSGIEELSAFRYYNVKKTVVPTARSGQPPTFKGQSQVIFADGHYFNLLPYRWLAGYPRTALTEPNSVVLDESRAKLYFPTLANKDIIGQKIIYDDTIVTTVSGIVADLDGQGNTDFSFKEFISLPTLLDNKWMRDQFNWDEWGSTASDHEVYVRLAKGVNTATVEAGLKAIFSEYMGDLYKKIRFKQTYLLQPLSDIHFNDDYGIFISRQPRRHNAQKKSASAKRWAAPNDSSSFNSFVKPLSLPCWQRRYPWPSRPCC